MTFFSFMLSPMFLITLAIVGLTTLLVFLSPLKYLPFPFSRIRMLLTKKKAVSGSETDEHVEKERRKKEELKDEVIHFLNWKIEETDRQMHKKQQKNRNETRELQRQIRHLFNSFNSQIKSLETKLKVTKNRIEEKKNHEIETLKDEIHQQESAISQLRRLYKLQFHPSNGSGNSGGQSNHSPASPKGNFTFNKGSNGTSNEILIECSEYEIPWKELKIKRKIGKGGFGEVFECSWVGDGGQINVCFKEIELLQGVSKSAILKEFLIAAKLYHPFVLRMFGYSENVPEGKVRFVMELMHSNLFQFVKRNQLTFYEKFKIMQKCTKAVHFLHSRRIIHRDIKSDNFLVDKTGKIIKVTDFGFAKTMASSFSASRCRGTPGYSPNECVQVGTANQYSKYSDVFSLGMLFYEVIYEKRPYCEYLPNVFAIVEMIKEGLLPDLRGKPIPVEFRKLMIQMWQQEPRKRPLTEDIMEFFEKHKLRMKRSFNVIL